MKLILILLFSTTSFLNCGKNIKSEPIQKQIEASLVNNITSISFTQGEIIGENHYGFKYDFNINVDTSSNINILDFCKNNFSYILNDRVADAAVISSILRAINDEDVMIDETPVGLRMVTSTSDFDAVSLNIFVEGNQLIKMELKYYSPL